MCYIHSNYPSEYVEYAYDGENYYSEMLMEDHRRHHISSSGTHMCTTCLHDNISKLHGTQEIQIK